MRRRRPLCRLPRLSGLGRFAAGLWAAGFPLARLGCIGSACLLPGMVHAADVTPARPPVQTLPDPAQIAPAPRAATPGPRLAEPIPLKPVPISLDTVLRLAQDQNSQINIHREKVREAFAEKAVADKKWLPDVWVGTSYYRHEGGIQEEDGTLLHSSFGSLFGGAEVDTQFDVREFAFQKVNAERKVWQQRGELSRLTSEKLMDAASAYIDFLAAYQGMAVIRDTDPNVQDLLKFAQGLAGYGKQAELSRVRAEMADRELLIARLRGQAEASRAKLAYLLGMGPECELVPVDNRLGILDLIDASQPLPDLISQALTFGPGIQEMEGLLALIQRSIDKSQGAAKYMPVVGLRMAEGVFGGGVGSRSDWDNRFDVILQARWNLTELFTARDRQRVSQARINQAHLSYDDLRGQLTDRVQEARATVLEGREEFRHAEEYIRQAKEAVQTSYKRLRLLPEIELKSTTDVLLSIRTQLDAQNRYVSAIRDYDKAQVALLILTGQAGVHTDGHCAGH